MSEQPFRTFDEFWPFYVRQHQKKATRILHFVGTTGAMACVAGGLLTKRRWLLALAPIVGYGPSWVGHFLVEKNRPATFAHPVWSLRADLVMWSKMARFQMDAEVERVLREDEERENAEREAAARAAHKPTDSGAGARSPNGVVN